VYGKGDRGTSGKRWECYGLVLEDINLSKRGHFERLRTPEKKRTPWKVPPGGSGRDWGEWRNTSSYGGGTSVWPRM